MLSYQFHFIMGGNDMQESKGERTSEIAEAV